MGALERWKHPSVWGVIAEMIELETFEEAISLVKFVRSCIADKIMSGLRESPGLMVEVEQQQLFMWRKMLNQSLEVIEQLERPLLKDRANEESK